MVFPRKVHVASIVCRAPRGAPCCIAMYIRWRLLLWGHWGFPVCITPKSQLRPKKSHTENKTTWITTKIYRQGNMKYRMFPVLYMPSDGESTLKYISLFLTLARIEQSITPQRTPPATIRWVHRSIRPARPRTACLALPHAVAVTDGVVFVPMTVEKARTYLVVVSAQPIHSCELREA